VSSDGISETNHNTRKTSRARWSCLILWKTHPWRQKTKITSKIWNSPSIISEFSLSNDLIESLHLQVPSSMMLCIYDQSPYTKKRINQDIGLTYPTRKSKGRDLNIFHPISQECSKVIEESIIAEYLKNAKTVNNDWYNNTHTSCSSL
jgi:hypothetical protein